jgi:hypothetical protein
MAVGEAKHRAVVLGANKISLKRYRFNPLFMEKPMNPIRGTSVKITKNNTAASRYSPTGFPGLLSSRYEYKETEPVHTIVADREARGQFAAGQYRTEGKFARWTPAYVLSTDEERRQCERRQHRSDVLLDTRVTPSRRRQGQSIDEEI